MPCINFATHIFTPVTFIIYAWPWFPLCQFHFIDSKLLETPARNTFKRFFLSNHFIEFLRDECFILGSYSLHKIGKIKRNSCGERKPFSFVQITLFGCHQKFYVFSSLQKKPEIERFIWITTKVMHILNGFFSF